MLKWFAQKIWHCTHTVFSQVIVSFTFCATYFVFLKISFYVCYAYSHHVIHIRVLISYRSVIANISEVWIEQTYTPSVIHVSVSCCTVKQAMYRCYHRLISWCATFRYCQVCWLLDLFVFFNHCRICLCRLLYCMFSVAFVPNKDVYYLMTCSQKIETATDVSVNASLKRYLPYQYQCVMFFA